MVSDQTATDSSMARDQSEMAARARLDVLPPSGATNVAELLAEVQATYLADARPWVIGYSGGKDSTGVLQLVWYALRGLAREELRKPVYVIASDTQVETPVIVQRIDTMLARINETAASEGLPVSAHKVRPTVEDTFWVNLIGKGYPAPTNKFRWCTERLKIKPANRFILERVAEFGEVVVVLGVRKAESSTRAQVMSLHRRQGSRLARHSGLPNAFVYAPIEDWTTQDVWTYLLQVPSPFGNDNRDLVALYTNAQAGECPLVIDKTTPSCGNSRFGCWVCTVVERDKTMESLIDAGEEWLEPLLEFRDLLAETQQPERKLEFREYRRRDGQVSLTRAGRLVPGPYKLEFCKQLLRRVLKVQREVQMEGPDSDLAIISPEELHEIRRIWRIERQDWDDDLPRIYRDVVGHDLDWVIDDVVRFTAADRSLLEQCCAPYDVSPLLLAKLLDVERDLAGLGRRATLFQRIDRVLGEEWRSQNDVLASFGLEPTDDAELAALQGP
jgi:DNA sulfur modification protein DndC